MSIKSSQLIAALGAVYIVILSQCWAQELGTVKLKQKLLQVGEALRHLTGVGKLEARVDVGDSQCSPLNTKCNYASASSVQISKDVCACIYGQSTTQRTKMCSRCALTIPKVVKDMRERRRNTK